MPLFSPYFPLESNAYRVGKSGQLRRQMGTAGFGLYVMVLSHLRDCPDCTAELDYDALGYELHEAPALVRRVVEDFDLFLLDREHGTFTAEALREVAAAARPRARSKRNNAERHRRHASRGNDGGGRQGRHARRGNRGSRRRHRRPVPRRNGGGHRQRQHALRRNGARRRTHRRHGNCRRQHAAEKRSIPRRKKRRK